MTALRQRALLTARVRWAVGLGRSAGGALALGALAVALGCASIEGTVPPRAVVASGGFRAGAARVDLTPIPGFPMGGHSIEGQTSRGYWTRLYARALYLEDARGHGLALVACDLWSMPSGLSDRVAAILAAPGFADRLGGRTLGREQVLLAASHTHQSPAAFASDRFFSMFAAPRAGFDPALHEFLAQRIAWAIAEAVAHAAPARVERGVARVSGAFRNRSLEPFLANPEASAVMRESGAVRCVPDALYPDPEACRAIDSRVTVLGVARADAPGESIALAVFLATHPELIGHDLGVYSGDLFGAVALQAEQRLRAAAPTPPRRPAVVAVFNGAEGDVSGVFTRQDRGDLLRAADVVTGAVLALARAGGDRVEGPIDWQVDLTASLALRRVSSAAGSGRTALLPLVGGATSAGAEDGPTAVPAFLAYEGRRGLGFGPQGRKLGAADPLGMLLKVRLPLFSPTALTLMILPPPRRVAMGVYRLGPLRLASLPGEFTTVMGRRVAAAVADGAGVARDDVLLVGLAQSYASYFATPEEYDLQHYEGSGTLYGRLSGAFVAQHLGRLAAALEEGPSPPGAHAFAHTPWFGDSSFDLADVTTGATTVDSTVFDVLRHVPGRDAPMEALPRHCWDDRAPTFAPPAGAAPTDPPHAVTPRAAIEQRAGDAWRPLEVEPGVPETDEGLRFLTLAHGHPARTRWCTFWIPPAAIDRSARYRFRIRALDGRDVTAPFTLD